MRNVKSLTTLDSVSVDPVILRLAHFDPNCKDSYGNQVLDHLLVSALVSFGNIPVSANELKPHLIQTYRVEFEVEEINAAGRRLSKRGLVEIVKPSSSENPAFLLSEEEAIRVKNVVKRIADVEQEVINDWKKQLLEKYQEVTVIQEHIEEIVHAFKTFLSRMIRRHAVECVSILYPDDSRAQSWLSEATRSIVVELPSIEPLVDAIVRLELPNFLENITPKRRVYISSILNASFFWHLIQIDETCSKLLQKATAGQRLYLDNNVLFSLSGLHGPDRLKSEHKLIELAQTLGYDIWATSKTVEEYQHSLQWQLNDFRKRVPLPSSLAAIAVKQLGDSSFVTSFWKKQVESGTTIDAFVADNTNIEQLLDGLGVKITSKFHKEINDSEEIREQESHLRKLVPDLNEHVIEHDAFHRVFIRKIRKKPRYSYSDAVAWFLTHDSKLPVFGRIARKGNKQLPFCITTDQWIQINRPLLPRYDDPEQFESMFYDIVTQPFLRSITSTFSLESAYREVLERLGRYKDMTPELALKVTTDRTFMIGQAILERDHQVDLETIDNQIVTAAHEFQLDNVQLQQQVTELSSRIVKIEESLGAAKNLKESLIANSKLSAGKLKRKLDYVTTSKNEATRKASFLEGKSKKIEIENEELSNQINRLKGLVKWGTAVVILLLLTFGLWKSLTWSPLDSHLKRELILVLLNISVVFAVLPIPAQKHWKAWLGSALVSFLAGITIFAQ